LQATLQRSLGNGLTLTANYTFSKTLSESDSIQPRAIDNSGPFTALYANNPAADYGLSGYNQKHTFVVNGQYEIPWDRRINNGVAKAVLGACPSNVRRA
jgi:hypothetical protein